MTTYYVDDSSPFASDANAGTSANQPLRSLAAVSSLDLKPGDVVAFKAGTTYTADAADDAALTIHASGTAAAPITFTSYGVGAAPVIDNAGSGFSDGIGLQSSSYVVINGLKFAEAGQAAVNIDANSSHITVENIEATNVGEGVLINGSDNLVTHNYLHDLHMVVNTPTSVNSNDDYGANGVVLSGNDNEVSFNKIVNATAQSYDYGTDGGGIELFGNVNNASIHDNWVEGSEGFIEAGSSNGTISNVSVVNNVSLNNGNFLTLHNGGGTFSTTLSNFVAQQNTIVQTVNDTETTSTVELDAAATAAQLLFQNNIVSLSSGDSVFNETGNYHSNNDFDLQSPSTHLYDDWDMTLGPNETFASPVLTRAADGSFVVTATGTIGSYGATLSPAQVGPLAPGVVSLGVVDVYNAAGVLTTSTATMSDGSSDKKTYAAGIITGETISFALGSADTIEFKTYTNGTLTRDEIDHADGSRDVTFSNIVGKTYVAEHDTYNAAGVQTGVTHTHADGTLDYSYVLSNGIATANQYDATGILTSSTVTSAAGVDKETFAAGVLTGDVMTYAAGSANTADIKTYANGVLTREEIDHADHSRDVTFSNIIGKTYTAEHDTYNAAGVQTSWTHTHADGSLDMSYALSADGTATVNQYTAMGVITSSTATLNGTSDVKTYAAGVIAGETIKFAAGSPNVVEYKTFTQGSLTRDEIDHSDGSRDVTFSNITGKTYVTEHDSYNAAGVQTSWTHSHADGSLDMTYALSANGTATINQYDASGALIATTLTTNGTSDSTYYTAGLVTSETIKFAAGSANTTEYKTFTNGLLTRDEVDHADHSRDVTFSNITGKSYVTEHDVYNTGGTMTSTDHINADGSHNLTELVTGQTVTTNTAVGATLSGPGSTTFAFQNNFGKDTISNFNAGDAVGHDVIQLDKGTVADFSHLQMSQVSADTVINVGTANAITLHGIIASHLTQSDFHFV